MRDLQTASPPAAMTSQNYLQLLHEKSDSFPSNLPSYANTRSVQSDSVTTTIPTSSLNELPYLKKEETFQDLPTLPQKLMIRSKTKYTNSGENQITNGLMLAVNNHFETTSEPHMNSDTLNGTKSEAYNYTPECMDSRRSS